MVFSNWADSTGGAGTVVTSGPNVVGVDVLPEPGAGVVVANADVAAVAGWVATVATVATVGWGAPDRSAGDVTAKVEVWRMTKSSAAAERKLVLACVATSPVRFSWGIINQSRPTASVTPIVPVATERPRPTTSGGSD